MGPSVLILGGLGQDHTRALLSYLLSLPKDNPERPSFIRVVDKYLIISSPDAFHATTYIDSATKLAFKLGTADASLEYIQGNLMTKETRSKAFTLSTSPTLSFHTVYDFTGEDASDAAEVVYCERTMRLAIMLAHDAVKFRVKAYLRCLSPFYKVKDGEKKSSKVGQEGVESEPWGRKAEWLHEAARAIALIDGLPLILVRPALFYGPYTITGVTPRVLIGECYRHQGEKLEFLWSDSLPQHTIHSHDFSSAISKLSLAYPFPSSCAEPLFPTPVASSSLLSSLSTIDISPTYDFPSLLAKFSSTTPNTTPTFTISDDGDTTSGQVAKLIEQVIGVKSGFHGSLISSFAKLNLGEIVEEANEKHLTMWGELLKADGGKVGNLPISPNVSADQLQPYPIDFSNEKLKKNTNWVPEFKLDQTVMKDTVDKFKKEGHWPDAKPKSSKK